MEQKNKRSLATYLLVKTAAFFVLIFALILGGCSIHHNKIRNTEAYEDGYKTFVFYDKDNGKVDKWKVVFKDDEIYRLYRNDKRIPDNRIDDYEDLVYDNFPGSVNNKIIFKTDNDWDSDDSFNFKFKWDDKNFDKKEFKKQMEELKKELKKMKKLKFHFDSEAFNEDMRELHKELENFKIPSPKIDMREFKRNMKEFSRNMKEHELALKDMDIHIPEINVTVPDVPEIHIPEINIDMSGFEEGMKHLDESMKDLDINMKNLDREMKKLDAFLDEFKDELIKENIIKNEKDDVQITYKRGILEIDGKKAPETLQKKYHELYKKHFGKEPEEHSSFNF